MQYREEVPNGDDATTITSDAQDQNEEADKDSEDQQVEKLPTLAQLVFSACDSCLYCGGKFVG